MKESRKYLYDVCLSFAGEKRDYVEEVYEALQKRGVRVFYDRDEVETARTLKSKLEPRLDTVYRDDSKYCILFVSKDYLLKKWTMWELEAALERSKQQEGVYIIPAYFDDTVIEGVSRDASLNLEKMSAERCARVIARTVLPGWRYPLTPARLRIAAAIIAILIAAWLTSMYLNRPSRTSFSVISKPADLGPIRIRLVNEGGRPATLGARHRLLFEGLPLQPAELLPDRAPSTEIRRSLDLALANHGLVPHPPCVDGSAMDQAAIRQKLRRGRATLEIEVKESNQSAATPHRYTIDADRIAGFILERTPEDVPC